MDPLSISASVVALLSAGGTLSKLLRKGIGLRNAPDLLRALNDEVAGLQSTATDVDDLLRTASRDPNNRPPKSLVSSLSRIKSTLLQLEGCISYQLTTVTADGDGIRLDRSVYLRAERRLQGLKDDIHASRIALASALSLFASSIGMQNLIQSRQIFCSLDLLHTKFEMIPALALHVFDTSQQNPFPLVTSGTIGTTSEVRERRPEISSRGKGLKNRTRPDPDAPSQSQNYDSQMIGSSKLRNQRQDESASIVHLIQNFCTAGCQCSCHSHIRIKSPKLLHTIFGSLFLSYRGYPPPKQACGMYTPFRPGCSNGLFR
jgi:hypothetical protein